MKKISVILSFMLALVVLSAWAIEAEAYNTYYDGCQNCHGDFRSGSYTSKTAQDRVAWEKTIHKGHEEFADCFACHIKKGDTPKLGGPSGDSFNSCVGCHGRDEDNENGGQRGAGLRQHHTVTGAASCGGCHSDNNPATFTPVGEDVPGLRNVEPCSYAVFGDYGSDNDGDNVYDVNDPDCQAPAVCGDGVLDPATE
jgi:hypothetical protein